MEKADIEVASRGVDVGSCPRQLCYPRGSFSDIRSPYQRGHPGSLSPAFAPGPLNMESPVRLAFGFALYGGFLTRLSQPLGAPDIFLEACRPSQTAHQPVFPDLSAQVRDTSMEEWCCIVASETPRKEFLITAPIYALHLCPYPNDRLQ